MLDSKDGELSAFAVYDKNRKKKIDQPPPSTGDKKKTAVGFLRPPIRQLVYI